MRRKFFIAILIVVAIATGFFRDHVFVVINNAIDTGSDEAKNLSMLKWGLTALFSLLYLSISGLLVYLLFRSKRYVWVTIISYCILFLIAFLAALSGYVFSSFEEVYPFVRRIMGVAQSPVPMMVVIVACYFNTKMTGTKV